MEDSFGRKITYLRLSVTELCNLRCRYCMPEDGVCKKKREEMLTEEEMLLAVRAGAELGIRKLRITGGEPLIKPNILSICKNASRISGIEELCLTTNGIRLAQMAGALRQSGVRRINMSLDTLDAQRYAHITRGGNLSHAIQGLHAALDTGFERVKVNAVLIGGFNDDEIPSLANLTRTYPIDVRFIELMPMYDSGDFGASAYLPCKTVLEMLPELRPEPADGGVARLYSFPGAPGRVGLISPVSAHFCAACTRMRLTADGRLKPCLHAPAEYSIKGLDLDGMKKQFRTAASAKPEWHGQLSCLDRSRAGRNMNQIGG